MALTTDAVYVVPGKAVNPLGDGERVALYRYPCDSVGGCAPTLVYTSEEVGAQVFSYDETITAAQAQQDQTTTYTYQWMIETSDGAGGWIPLSQVDTVMKSIAPPEVTIIADADNNGVITAGELDAPANQQNTGKVHYGQGVDAATPLDQTVGVTVKVPAYAKAGDSIRLDNGAAEVVKVTLDAADITNGVFTVRLPATAGSAADLAAKWFGQDGSTSLNGHDKAFINSDSEIVIDPITADNVINATEAAETVTVTGTAKGALAQAGDTVTLTINGKDYTGTLDADKKFKIDVAGSELAANQHDSDGNGQPEVVAVVVVKDPFGGDLNIDGYHNYGVDVKVPQNGEAPLVEITTDTDNDGFINRAEWQQGGEKVDVKVSFDNLTVEVGDTLVVRALGKEKTFVLTADEIKQGFVITEFPTPQQGTNIVVQAQITDPAGNQSKIGQDTAKLDISDLQKDGVKVVISEDENNDGYISATELKGDIDILITLPKDTQAGDKVFVDATGHATVAVALTQAQVDAGSITLAFKNPGNGVNFEVSAQVKDAAGNVSNIDKDSAIIQTALPDAPVVTITEDANNDGFINAKELQGDVDVSIGLPSTVKAGDTLKISDNHGHQHDIVLSANDVQSGHVKVTFPAPASGDTIKVTATVTDAAHNTGPAGEASAIVDTTAYSGLGVEIATDSNNDGFINQAELAGGKVEVVVTLAQGAAAGDTLTVTASGNTAQVVVLSDAQVAAGKVTVEFNPTANGTDFVTTASIKDVAGNSAGPVQDEARIYTAAPGEPTVTITEDANDDGWISAAELQGEIDVSVTLPATANVGDTVVLTDQSGKVQETVLTLEMVQKGSVAFVVTNPGEGGEVKVEAFVRDIAGNPSVSASDSAKIDTKVPGNGTQAPVVTLTDDIDDNGYINAKEFKDGGEKIDVKVSLSDAAGVALANVEVGDRVEITDQTGAVQSITLTAQDIAAGYVTAVIATPANGKEAVATAVVKDAAGNASAEGKDSAVLDLDVPGNGTQAPVVTLTDDIDDNGYINAKEFKDPLNVKIDIGLQNVNVGDVLVISANGTVKEIVLTAANIADGAVVTTVANPGEGQTAEVTALIRDAAGNQSATGLDTAIIDTQVQAGTLALTDFTDSVNPYLPGTDNDSHSNDKDYGLQVSGQEAGSAVQYQVKIGGVWTDTTAVQSGVADGEYVYRAKVTDVAGNVGYTNEVAVSVDATAPAAPVHVVLGDDLKSVRGEAEAGAVVIIRDAAQNVLATGTADDNGQFTIHLPNTVSVTGVLTATAMDKAGNESSTAEAGRHYKVYTAASNWNSDTGPADYGSYKTTSGDDWLEIGNGAKNWWTLISQGNIWNKNPAKGWMVIDTGAGDDRIDTGAPGNVWLKNGGLGNMFACTGVSMGTGNDTFNLKGSMVNDCWVNMGNGDNTVRIGGFMGVNTEVRAYEGNDNIEVRGDMLLKSKILTDAGNDVLNLKGNMVSGCLVDMGAGDDVMTLGGYLGVSTTVNMGEGNDRFEFKGAMLLGSSVNMGAGDDVVVFKGGTVDGKINGGTGNDTLILDHGQNHSLVSGILAWKNVTNISTADITGFETVKLAGNNALDIRYKDLLGDGSRDGALFVQGGGNSKVDLGSTDWNSDRDYNLRDAGGGSWAKTGSSVVDGIAYDVYHHSNAGTSVHNDVYIQQGIMVI